MYLHLRQVGRFRASLAKNPGEEFKFHLNRRRFLLTSAATVAAASMAAPAFAADPILIDAPTAQSGPVGVADQGDRLNGVTMAVEEINAAGGVNGRMLETRVVDSDLLTPEGTVAAFQSLTEQGVHALAHSFAIIPQPAMDVAAVTGTPYLHGNTSQASLDLLKSDPQKDRNIFQVDVAETWHGARLARSISDARAAGWVPKNNRVHIVQEQIGHTQVISKATQHAIAASNGAWAVGVITDIQFPVQDWSPIIQALKEQDAGMIMIDHRVAAELASFANASVPDPAPGTLVYLLYGPSQPEFLDLAAENAEGFIWGAAIKTIKYRGVCGTHTFADDGNSGTPCPNQTDDPKAGQAHLIFQVQDGAHRIIAPAAFAEVAFRLAPWM